MEITKYNIAHINTHTQKKPALNLELNCTISGSIVIIGASVHSLNQKGDLSIIKLEVVHL